LKSGNGKAEASAEWLVARKKIQANESQVAMDQWQVTRKDETYGRWTTPGIRQALLARVVMFFEKSIKAGWWENLKRDSSVQTAAIRMTGED